MAKFTRNSIEDNTNILADHLPEGKLLCAKNTPDTVTRNILETLGRETARVENTIATIAEELNIFNTTLLIERWESALGIPDDCINIAPTIEERRANVLIKIQASGVATKQEFEDLALTLGFVVTVTPHGDQIVPPITPPYIPGSFPASRFIMVVTGVGIVPNVPPYDLPFIPGGNEQGNVLQCMFNLLKPANVTIIFSNIIPPPVP